jgi:glycyl-tRNA synthetase beta subunit
VIRWLIIIFLGLTILYGSESVLTWMFRFAIEAALFVWAIVFWRAIENRVDKKLFREESERKLSEAFEALKTRVQKDLTEYDYASALREIAAIRRTVDQFFDDVLVMDEDISIRQNRLALLQQISELFLSIADISEIVHQGGQDE